MMAQDDRKSREQLIQELCAAHRELKAERAARHQAEEALRGSERRFQRYVENSPYGIVLCDMLLDDEGKAVDYIHRQGNAAIARHTGWKLDEVINRRASDMVTPDVLAQLLDLYGPVVSTGEPVSYTQHFDLYDRTLQVSTFRLDKTQFIITFIDISELKKMERRLSTIEQGMENSLNGFDIVDEEGRFVYVNTAYVEMWGYNSAEEIIGTSPVSHCADPDTPRHIIAQLRQHGRCTLEFQAKRKDGSLFDVLMYAHLDRDEHGKELYFSTSLDMTERKQAEEAARAYSAFLDSIIDQSPFAMWVGDASGTVVRTNRALRETLNLSDSQIIGQYNVFQDTNLIEQGVMPQIQAVLTEKTPARFSLPWTASRAGEVDFSGGRDLWIDVAIFPVLDSERTLLNVVCQWVDITQQKQMEAALRDKEILFRTVFEQAAVGIAQVRPDGTFLQVNRRFSDIVGYTPEELLTKNFQDITHPDDVSLDMQYIPRVLDGSIDTFDIEKRYLHKQGHQVWIHLYSSVVRDEIGTVEYAIAVITDERERKQIEEKLREDEERFRLVIETLPVGLWLADKEGALLLGNPAGQKIWAAHPHVGQTQYGIFKAWRLPQREWIEPDDWALGYAVNEGKTTDRELLEIEALDGAHKIILNWAAPIKNDRGEIIGAFVINQDVTAQTQMEQEIRQLNRDLEQRVQQRTQQLEAANKELEAFTYSVSHDLRAPLRGIDGFSLALLEDFADQLPPPAQHYLHRVRSAAQRMGRLIDDLLRLSRISRCELHDIQINLSLLAEKIAAELSQEQPDRQVEFSIAPDLLAVADQSLMHLVLENLLRNAWKFTRPRTLAHIEFGSQQESGELVFFLRDNGVGFDMQHAHKLFEAFQRFHDPKIFQGTGIGLAIVQRIIHRHSGRVWAESDIEQGTAVYFTLPSMTEPS